MPRKVYMLEGLNCANCASKIQDSIENLNDVESVKVSFASQKLDVELKDGSSSEQVLSDIKQIVKRYEPNVTVTEAETRGGKMSAGNMNAFRKDAVFLFAAILLYIAALVSGSPYKILFYIAAYFAAGWDVLLGAGRNIVRGKVFDENFLMSIATIGAFAIGEYPEAAAVMLFYKTGELFQDIAVDRSRRSIKSLIDIRPDHANVKTAGGTITVPPEQVSIGDIIVVKPGERIPLDGVVVSGRSEVDTSALTGESVPRDVITGDDVLSGFINKSGVLNIRVTKSFNESAVSRILELVENASAKKAVVENFISKFARYYTPAVVGTAALIALLPPLISGTLDFFSWGYRALVFLVVSCPCALVVSIPLSFFGGIGGASRKGILVKGGNYLEALNNIGAVVFDKTGTLTKGVFKVNKVSGKNGFSESTVLEYAALAEAHSTHPIAVSISEAYGRKADESRIQSYEEMAGHGIKAVIDGKKVLVGNDKLMVSEGFTEYGTCNEDGTVVHVAIDGVYSGCISISDEIKEDSAWTVKELKRLGIPNIVIMSGDSAASVKSAAQLLNIDSFHAGLLPHEKVEKIEEIQYSLPEKGRNKLVFVGDGINDAPVLARADIGISMGALGSDAAIEASDIVLMNDEPSRLIDAIMIAKKTRKIVWQNIVFALGVKAAVLILGASGAATMWEAVFADVGVALVAVLNALRSLKYDGHTRR